jgi:class 3 adenylate cyclase
MAQPASPRTILVVDVEKFSGLDRTDSQRVTVHDSLYGVLQSAFRETGISWDDCRVEDRGDGVLILAPADIPKTRFSDELPGRLAAGLRAHNQEHSRPERMRLRMALNAGEVFSMNTGRSLMRSIRHSACWIVIRSGKPCETRPAPWP